MLEEYSDEKQHSNKWVGMGFKQWNRWHHMQTIISCNYKCYNETYNK